jgi:hypothetical protein
VTKIILECNEIGVEGASALADALKVNKMAMTIEFGYNNIGDEGSSALADALKENTSLTNINLQGNTVCLPAFADALLVNTSIIANIDFGIQGHSTPDFRHIHERIERNRRFRHLFLFDARQMLLSVLCADECGVVLPYLLDKKDKDAIVALDNVETSRAEFAVVVEERRRRASTAVRVRSVEGVVDERGRRAAKRNRANR